MKIVDIVAKHEDDYGYRDFVKSSVLPICITELMKNSTLIDIKLTIVYSMDFKLIKFRS